MEKLNITKKNVHTLTQNKVYDILRIEAVNVLKGEGRILWMLF